MTVETNSNLAIIPRIDSATITEALPTSGAVAVFEPRDSRQIQDAIRCRQPIPEGAFMHGKLFDLSNKIAETEKGKRFSLPLVRYVIGLLEDNKDNPTLTKNSEDLRDPLSIQLAGLEVEASNDTAVAIEAARQWVDEHDKGILTDKRSQWLKKLLNEAQDRMFPPLSRELADFALNTIHGIESDGERMSPEAREAWHAYLHETYDPIFDELYEEVHDDAIINGRLLADMTASFMQKTALELANPAVIGPNDENDPNVWTVVYDPNLSSFNVNASTTINTGDRSKALDTLGFEKLMMHEELVHAWRGENGSRTGYSAFQKGLPGYADIEEGIGLLIEALWSGEDPDQLGRDHFRYAAVAYASGVYDGILHTEQETYDFTKELMDQVGVDDPDELYRHVMRIFRGMPTGCRWRSNASYLAGKIAMERELEARFKRGDAVADTFTDLQAGKIDNTDQVQVQLLNRARNNKV